MWPRTDLLELLGIAHPIVQAPMSGFTTPALAAAVCNAGGLGSIGCATLPAATIREQVAAIRQATNRPFNLNFFVHAWPLPAPERAAHMRARLAPYFAEFGLGSVPEPSEPFATLCSSARRFSVALKLSCRPFIGPGCAPPPTTVPK